MSLPIDRTALIAAQTNQVPSQIIQSAKNIAAIQTPYDAIDELNNKVNGLVSTTSLSPYPPAQYNQLINSNFDVWQRGTSLNTSGTPYTADRWQSLSSINTTFSKQSASPPVGSSTYARATINTLGGFFNLAQAFESDICNKLKGKAISVSIQLRRDATYDGQYIITIEKNTVADTSGGTWVTVASSASFTLNTPWTTYKFENIVIPNDGTTNGLRIQIAAQGGTRPVNSYVEFAQVELNTGTLALPFQPRSLGDELVSSLRFNRRITAINSNGIFGNGAATSTTQARIFIPFGIRMRAIPTLTSLGSFALFINNATTVIVVTAISAAFANMDGVLILADVASGLTVGTPVILIANNDATAYINFDSEL